ncbi:MAG TPA: Maf family nucleotide pyrophosphatase [Burkholderiaceae bacterium]|nr:Maf family nucleotide pyrophosphatase [Burkholderiaceae bacterium]
MIPIVLASTSRYRRQLLQRLRLPFDVVAPAVDETALPGEAPEATAVRLATRKAIDGARQRPGGIVIGSDQVADLEGRAIGKPGDFANAVAQLEAMSARQVVFHTALAVLDSRSGALHVDNVPTFVTYRHLDRAAIETYLRLDEPFDCAGSARIESLGVCLAESVRSDDPTALVGLPLIRLVGLLQACGFDVLAQRP